MRRVTQCLMLAAAIAVMLTACGTFPEETVPREGPGFDILRQEQGR